MWVTGKGRLHFASGDRAARLDVAHVVAANRALVVDTTRICHVLAERRTPTREHTYIQRVVRPNKGQPQKWVLPTTGLRMVSPRVLAMVCVALALSLARLRCVAMRATNCDNGMSDCAN